MTVRQTGRGAACHTGRKSCFYRSVETENGIAVLEDMGLPKLFDPKDVYGK
ncbi:phosphoribosyl-AMP cyclohydrolase [compost metagenome]